MCNYTADPWRQLRELGWALSFIVIGVRYDRARRNTHLDKLRNGIGMGSGCTHFYSGAGIQIYGCKRAERLKAEFWTKYFRNQVSGYHVDNLKAENAVENSEFR